MTENYTAAERFRGITAPRQTWRGMSNSARYIAYARISLQIIGISMLFMLSLPLLSLSPEVDLPTPMLVLFIALGMFSMVLTLLVFELHPDLNSRERRSLTPIFRFGLVFNAGAWLLGVGLVLLPVSDEVRALAALSSVWVVFTLSLAYLPWLRYRWLSCVAVSLLTLGLVQRVSGTGVATYFWMLGPLFLLGTVLLTIWTINLFNEVESARHAEAALKVTEERLRFSQELHDTLGQHLAAMSLKAELALALARRGDERLEGELQQLQRLARTSMSEMHEVVQGYRTINLATEVAGAQSLLADSGIEIDIDGDALDVGERDRELAAWFVREATTNVLRHSHASRVQLELGPGAVRMRNDGATGEIQPLSGLRALDKRAGNSGSQLLVERDGRTFTARLILGGAQ